MQRRTMQKSIVAETLNELMNHPTADMVYDRVHEKRPGISKSTVYRILGNMASDGSAMRVRISNGADRFDYQTFPHYHVCCTCCGRVDDVMIPQLSQINLEPSQASGYLIRSHNLTFDGICPKCQKAMKGKASA